MILALSGGTIMRSIVKRNKFERMGDFILISFNERMVAVESEPETETQYEYDAAKVKLLAPRKEVIQTIMRTRYPDMDSEFAARINGGTEEEEHESLRVTAKLIADEFEIYVSSVL